MDSKISASLDKIMKKHFLLVILSLVLIGCSTTKQDQYSYAASTGAATGAFIGASTGAIYGAVVPGVSAAEGAAVGGGAGLVIGAAVSYGAVKQAENAVIDRNNQVIAQNYEDIVSNNSQIYEYRQKVESEINLLEPTTNRAHDELPGSGTEIY